MLQTIRSLIGRRNAVNGVALGSWTGRRLTSIAAAVGVFAAGAPAVAVELGQCMEDRCSPQVCTANDVNLVLVGLGVQDDGCVGPEDTVDIYLRSIASTSTGQTRYDISMWFAVDGDPNGDGARSGTCAVEILTPAASTQSNAPLCLDEDPGGVEFNCGAGPFLNADGDACGDITKGNNLPDCGREDDVTDPSDGNDCSLPDGLGDSTIMDFTEAITFPCTDTYDPVGSPPDGFVDLPYCVTWHNQALSTDCDFPNTPICPSQTSKCTCETGEGAATNIPAPNLGLSCSCSPDPVLDGEATCTVTYTNPDTTPPCDYDPNTLERFRCGTAAFVRFEADYDEDYGSITAAGTAGTGGGGVVSDSNGVLQWTPASRNASSAIVGPGDSASLTFTYDPDAVVGSQMIIPVRTYWSDSEGFDPNVLQAAATTLCEINLSPTWAMVSEVRAVATPGGVVLKWDTAAEAATIGFHVERFDAASGSWTRVNEHLLPAVRQTPGATYRLVDAEAPPSRLLRYRITEVEAKGGIRSYGPYDLEPRAAVATPPAATGFAAKPRAPSPRVLQRAGVVEKSSPVDPTSGSGMVKVHLRETGIYRVGGDELAVALDVSRQQLEKMIVKGRLALSNMGSPVAWTPTHDRSGILFYGEAPIDELSPDNVYWIGQGAGLLMETATRTRPYAEPPPEPQSFVDTVVFEEDLLPMVAFASDPRADLWTWGGVLAGDPTYGVASFELELDDVARSTADAAVVLQLWGLAGAPESPNHETVVRLNGVEIGTAGWDGSGQQTLELGAPHELLADGANTVEIEGLAGNFAIDSIAVRYERHARAAGGALLVPPGGDEVVGVSGFSTPFVRILDLSDARRPMQLDPASITEDPGGSFTVAFRRSSSSAPYLLVADPAIRTDAVLVVDAASDLRSPGNRGEYVVIAPRALAESAEALAGYRMSRGLETRVVLLDDIMDEFNHGLSSPYAIRDFLEAAWRGWRLPPRYAVLIGKGSFDYRDRLGLGGNLVPPMLVPNSSGLAAADLRLGDVDGDDGVPEIAIGRIPVLDAAELDAYVSKIGAYEASRDGDWRRRVLMVADNADVAGDFQADSDALVTVLPDDAVVERVYLDQPYTAAEARSRLLAAIDEGVSLLNYVGHGGSDRLAAENILDTSDIAAMNNGDALPVVTAFTCYLALFDYPGYVSLGEELVVHPDGGAAAVWGPTGLSSNQRAVQLANEALARLPGSGQRVGDVVAETMRAFSEGGGKLSHLDVYTFLGDPALEGP
jgi:hypothetical protein